MSRQEFTESLWRNRVLTLITASIVTGAAAFFLSGQEAVYRASATLAFLPNSDNPPTASFYGPLVERLLPTYAELPRSKSFLDKALGGVPAAEGRAPQEHIHTELVPDSGVMRIVARSSNPELAAVMASAVADAVVEALRDDEIFDVELIDHARVPKSPVAPRQTATMAAAVVLGLTFGIAAALASDRLFERIYGASQLARVSCVPVLATLPRHRRLRRDITVFVGDPKTSGVERNLRTLRTNLLVALRESGLGVVVVTSPGPDAGKSTVVANLALVTAELGLSVLVVDAELRRPRQHELFGVPRDKGLAALGEETEFTTLRQSSRYDGVTVITAGPPVEGGARSTEAALARVSELAGLADVVLIDAPSLDAEADVRVVSGVGIMLVVPAGAARPDDVRAAVASLDAARCPVLGAVLVGGRDVAPRQSPVPSPADGRDAQSRSGESVGIGVPVRGDHGARRPPHRNPVGCRGEAGGDGGVGEDDGDGAGDGVGVAGRHEDGRVVGDHVDDPVDRSGDTRETQRKGLEEREGEPLPAGGRDEARRQAEEPWHVIDGTDEAQMGSRPSGGILQGRPERPVSGHDEVDERHPGGGVDQRRP